MSKFIIKNSRGVMVATLNLHKRMKEEFNAKTISEKNEYMRNMLANTPYRDCIVEEIKLPFTLTIAGQE